MKTNIYSKILAIFITLSPMSVWSMHAHISSKGNITNSSIGGNVSVILTEHYHIEPSSPTALTPEQQAQLYEEAFDYERGRNGKHQNLSQAVEMYEFLCKLHHGKAQWRLGTLLLEGGGELARDVKRAQSLLLLAADHPVEKAMLELYKLYKEGKDDIIADPARSDEFLVKAAWHGDDEARHVYANIMREMKALPEEDRKKEGLGWLTIFSQCVIKQQDSLLGEMDWVSEQLEKFSTFPHSQRLLTHEGKSLLDLACLYQLPPLFQQLIRQGHGYYFNAKYGVNFYKSLFHRAKEANIPISPEILTAFYRLEDMNSDFKFHMAVAHLLGGSLTPSDTLSNINMEGVITGRRKLPLSVFGERPEFKRVKKINQEGRCCVASSKSSCGRYQLYFKFFPEIPGMEMAVGLLTRSLIGFGASPCDVFKIEDEIEVLTLKNKIGGYWSIDTEEHTLSRLGGIPVVVSLGIEGPSLKEFFKNPSLDFSFDSSALFKMLIVSMLINPEDGKGDNYICEVYQDEEGQTKYRVIGIDNDHAFVPALTESSKRHVRISSKTVLYAFNEMNYPISDEVQQHFKALDFNEVLFHWIQNLRYLNGRLADVFEDEELTNLMFENYHSFIGIPMAPTMVARLYTKCMKLQSILSPEMTPLALLLELEPILKGRYGAALKDLRDQTPAQRFKMIEGEAADKTLSRPLDLLVGYDVPTDAVSRKNILRQRFHNPGTATDELEEMIQQRQEFEAGIAREVEGFQHLKEGGGD